MFIRNSVKAIVLGLMFICVYASAQTSAIKIKFIGNCGMHLSDGKENLYLDFPYKSGAFNYMKYDKSELDSIKENAILFSRTGTPTIIQNDCCGN